MKRADASQQVKYASFKRAFETIGSYREQENYLAAYVVTFSVIEDRLQALYVIWYRAKHKGADPAVGNINSGFAKLVRAVAKDKLIPDSLMNLLLDEAKRRNALMHSAMWNLDQFDEQVVGHAMKLARATDRASQVAKKQPVK